MKILRALLGSERVAILGSGEIGRSILNCFSCDGRFSAVEFLLFDSAPEKQGRQIDRHMIHSLEELRAISPGLVILAFNGSKTAYAKAALALRRYYTGLVFTALEVFDEFPEVRGWPLRKESYYKGRLGDFERIYSLLSDRESKKQFAAYYQWASRKRGAKPPEGPGSNQYFDSGLIKLVPEEVFVDCGAFRGDTLASFLGMCGGVFGEYYAFEPDRTNFSALIRATESQDATTMARIYCMNMAVVDKSRYVSFSSESTQYSHVGDTGSQWVQGVALDEFKFRKAPTFLKLDLEGQDYRALFGALNTLLQHKPILCVAIYHNPEDLFDIPLLLTGALPGYSFYVRAHNRFAFDFVLYCIPPDRTLVQRSGPDE